MGVRARAVAENSRRYQDGASGMWSVLVRASASDACVQASAVTGAGSGSVRSRATRRASSSFRLGSFDSWYPIDRAWIDARYDSIQ